MLTYAAYGLTVESSGPIPGLTPSHAPTGERVRVHLRQLPAWLEKEEAQEALWYVNPAHDPGAPPVLIVHRLLPRDWFRMRFWDGTEFLLDAAGSEVFAVWPQELTLEDTATYLLGPVFGFLLLLRGFTVLHASAVAVDGRAFALLGSQGAGKSTTAAALAEMGLAVLAEDVVALRPTGSQFLVQPAYPRIRLWPSSVRLLYGREDSLPLLTPGWDKRFLDLTSEGYAFAADPCPLAAVYVLADRSDEPSAPSLAPLSPAEAMLRLIGNAYAGKLYDRAGQARDFEVLGRIAAGIPVRLVAPSSDPSRLGALCERILADFLQSCGAALPAGLRHS